MSKLSKFHSLFVQTYTFCIWKNWSVSSLIPHISFHKMVRCHWVLRKQSFVLLILSFCNNTAQNFAQSQIFLCRRASATFRNSVKSRHWASTVVSSILLPSSDIFKLFWRIQSILFWPCLISLSLSLSLWYQWPIGFLIDQYSLLGIL